jgi:hypothetical protein
MFWVADQVTGIPFSIELPSPRGPRHEGQFSACRVGKNAQKQAKTMFMGYLVWNAMILYYPIKCNKGNGKYHFNN